ncbi:Pfs, NACHT, and Ankyrin domain protein [Aspergillus thermomutatus]|uniref:Uncharacterized protein n=1 Tax=Aspergillus thermomutatus TaxID=41047 RepID=A0A397HHN3_ASPTH|nr:uncharacterized protein CDV56_102403 [Aspergillus thermomutatus]RHZ62439.1 hypothetical protein CDV56_102403 [Aspergillus thermomutatus]
MKARVLSHSDYTVAWICALPIEMAAAKSLLDEIHNPLAQSSIDRNIYTLGSLSGHNLVIVCLPSGVHGTTSATSVVIQTIQPFPCIRFGLMVGVGGGVPDESHGIRLGDVVVSTPTAGSGGVIQYDYGKTYRDGYLQRTGSLNKPPQILLNATSQMRCDSMLQKTNIGKIVSDALQGNLAIERSFVRPDNDWLFRSTYEHQGRAEYCSSCDKSQLVQRAPRASNEPHIHYGLIASGNQVMKDARTRDSIAKELHALCFEMEAAGLMDQLPCLVIRGICDYSDSHKHKEWQGYAALVAAAYTKALISIIPLAKDTVLQEQVSELTEKEKECLENLFITDPEEDMNALKRRKGNRTSGTCSWFLESNELKSWFRGAKGVDDVERNVLWLYGNPGIGKSTMAITLAEELPKQDYFSNGNNVLSYFFCEASSEHQRKATSILRGLLYQIINQYPPFIKQMMSKYDVQKGRLFTSFDALWAMCLHLASKAGNLEVVCKLVGEGHDILLQDVDGLSPFHYALHGGRLDVLHFMSETCNRALSGVWHSLDHFGKTPLHHHVSSDLCSAEVIDFLVQLGCDVNESDTEGNSSLGLYMGSSHLLVQRDIFFLLVQKGADPLWVNGYGQNLAHLLMHYRGADNTILEFLFDIDLDPGARDLDGKTFMHHGETHGAFTKELVEFLRRRGVLDLHATDSFGKTPLNYAEEQAHREVPEDILWRLDRRREESFKNLNTITPLEF